MKVTLAESSNPSRNARSRLQSVTAIDRRGSLERQERCDAALSMLLRRRSLCSNAVPSSKGRAPIDVEGQLRAPPKSLLLRSETSVRADTVVRGSDLYPQPLRDGGPVKTVLAPFVSRGRACRCGLRKTARKRAPPAHRVSRIARETWNDERDSRASFAAPSSDYLFCDSVPQPGAAATVGREEMRQKRKSKQLCAVATRARPSGGRCPCTCAIN